MQVYLKYPVVNLNKKHYIRWRGKYVVIKKLEFYSK